MQITRLPGKTTQALRARLSQLEQELQARNIELPPQTPVDHVHHRQGSIRRHSALSISSGRSSDTSQFADDEAAVSSSSIQQFEEPRRISSTVAKESLPLSAISKHCPANTHAPVETGGSLEMSSNFQNNSQSFETYTKFNDAMPLHGDSSPSARLTNYAGISQTETPDPDNITSSLSARMGSLQIAEDGQLRYYGPTSNLHLYHAGLHSLSRSTIRHVATEGTEVLARAGLNHPVAPDVERHLAELYFAWAIHVVGEDIFFP